MIDPGRLRERIDIHAPGSIEQTSAGTLDGDPYDKVATGVPARVEEDAGQTDMRAGAAEPEQRVTITLRARDEITADHRITWNGRTIEIDGIKRTDPMRRYQRIVGHITDGI